MIRNSASTRSSSIAVHRHQIIQPPLDLRDAAGAHQGCALGVVLQRLPHFRHLPEHVADLGIDARHEDVGHAWLAQYFGPEVTAPVRMHVDAKRYLCATEPGYFVRLSAASVRTLALQGGPMMSAQAAAFEALPFARDAVAVRRWDDAAKVPGLAVPGLEHYRVLLEAVLWQRDEG